MSTRWADAVAALRGRDARSATITTILRCIFPSCASKRDYVNSQPSITKPAAR
jgi:hypothetical protein